MKMSVILFCALLLLAGSGATAASAISAEARYRELVMVVDRNAGHAHFTRGMNSYTIMELQNAVGESDIPVLQKMLGDKDRIVVMTTVNVLMRMSAQGRRAVYETLLTTDRKESRNTIAEQLSDLPNDMTLKARIPGWTDDITFLKRMAENRDLRTIWAARDLLKAMGEPGQAAIREILATTKNQRTREMLKGEAGR